MFEKYELDKTLITKRNKHNINIRIKSNLCGYFDVVGIHKRTYYNDKTEFLYVCEFDNGYQKLSTISNIKKGKVYNPYYPTHLGVGFLGESYQYAKKSNYYSLWKSILKRCSDGFQESYKNTYISQEWYNFTNFENDINLIVGYKEYIKFKDSIKFEIDKDIFGNGELYSKESCCFVPRDINSFFKRTPTTNNSGAKGVSWDDKRSKWKAQCLHNGIQILNKRFDNKAEAVSAYNEAKKYSLKIYLDNDYAWLAGEIKKQCISKINDNKFW